MSDATSTSRSSAQSTFLPVVVLLTICMVAGALLGLVHSVTSPIAEANAQQKAQETYALLVPEADSFEPVPCEVEGCTAALEARDASGAVIAHVIVAQSKGYGGQVPIAVAFGSDGTVSSITTMSNEETPGLGTKVADESYIGQYVGMAAAPASQGDVDLISGATISSKAVLAAYNIAVEAYEEVR